MNREAQDIKPVMVAHASDTSTWEVDTGGSEVQVEGQSVLYETIKEGRREGRGEE